MNRLFSEQVWVIICFKLGLVTVSFYCYWRLYIIGVFLKINISGNIVTSENKCLSPVINLVFVVVLVDLKNHIHVFAC